MGYDVSLDNVGGGEKPSDKENNNNNNNAPAKATLRDVENGGEWIVRVGDSLSWNYLELYYKDGKLWKIVCHFQKNDDEEPEIQVIEGEEAVAEFSLYFIDYTIPASQLVEEIKTKIGYTNVSIKPVS